jgi:hypothetical protein
MKSSKIYFIYLEILNNRKREQQRVGEKAKCFLQDRNSHRQPQATTCMQGEHTNRHEICGNQNLERVTVIHLEPSILFPLTGIPNKVIEKFQAA